MRQLLPSPREQVEPWEVYRPADPERPLLRLNMVTSADGAATDLEGRSGGLGGEGDWKIFRTLRAQADAVLVGAGTARAEGYGPGRVKQDLAEPRRRDLGRQAPPGIVIVSRSLDLDPEARIFTDAVVPTTVLTCSTSDSQRRAALAKVAFVVVAGSQRVDLAAGLAQVRASLGPLVVCEGGPTLNADLLAAGLVDELCLTLSPQLRGGPDAPRLGGLFTGQRDLRLHTACSDDSGELYLRYRLH